MNKEEHAVDPNSENDTRHYCRVCGEDAEWTFATGWRHIDGFWYQQKSPMASGYAWLTTEHLWVMLLERNDAALVWDDDKKHSAILNTQDGMILTVNGEIINWHENYIPLMRMLITARWLRGSMLKRLSFEPITKSDAWITELENGARTGPGQAEENWVNKLTCGHEVDTEEELPDGKKVHCSVHGEQTVVNPK